MTLKVQFNVHFMASYLAVLTIWKHKPPLQHYLNMLQKPQYKVAMSQPKIIHMAFRSAVANWLMPEKMVHLASA